MRFNNFTRRSFNQLLLRADLPKIRFHDLRHTAATLMIANGINPKVVQETLGHSKVSTTLSIYAHVSPSMQAGVATMMDDLFRRKLVDDCSLTVL